MILCIVLSIVNTVTAQTELDAIITIKRAQDDSEEIPENLPDWTEMGTVLSTNPNISWEEQNQIAVAGVAKVGTTYYLFYLAGFDGCWNADGDCNHQSVGLATSTDGINFTKYSGNPILIPHDFLPVESEEEGIRTGYVHYIPSKNKFYGYFGIESPGGSGGCPYGGGVDCGCNVGVDAAVFLATSSNAVDWTIEGQVSGAGANPGDEVYASGWVFDGTTFYLYINTAEGGYCKSASKGTDPLNLNYMGGVSALDFGWAGVDTYLHDDNNTVTLMYEPSGGSHPGCSNDNLYFATTYLDDIRNIENERVITDSGHERNIIFKDGTEWKWYYSDEADEYNNAINMRTHPVTALGTSHPSLSTPDDFTLQQNYPNPFNLSTTIEYTVAEPCDIQIKIYNLFGREVHVLVNEYKLAGKFSVTWDGKNAEGNELANGIYFYKLTAGKQSFSKKMLYMATSNN
ncbi:MAG: T9SS type A sorting domain-containing protein [Bacteroidales bacterium]|nr:T9SS type A sorting domain-containing protein [Bacteroidales bacterium]